MNAMLKAFLIGLAAAWVYDKFVRGLFTPTA